MPRTIQEGFNDFHSKLTPSGGESSAAKLHRASIKACLESNFGLNRFVRIGSFGNGTSISGYSDVDYLAEIPSEKLKVNSTTSLQLIRDALTARFPQTGVRVSCPAVQCPFGNSASERTEIVPADLIGNTGGHKMYEIADCDGGWMKVSPDAHNAYVDMANDKLSGRVKPLIRFIKAWKYFCNVPISSFYLEMRVAKYASDEPAIIYDLDIQRFMDELWRSELAAMRDPMGIAGNIKACKTESLREDAMSKLLTASVRADKARQAEESGKTSEAFAYWRLFYNDEFPTYYY